MEYIQPNQKISFYNVTGLIERDKNIFYSPRIEDLLAQNKTTVCESYKSLFDVVCPPPFTELTDLVISQWNPKDRELKVNCSVDYFRKGSAGRNTLNYAILEVDKGAEKFYYGYFINDSRQNGVNSCYVYLQLDEFTNVCYLSNTKLITSDFNPLKSFIANAFVERQHYDRVKVMESYLIDDDIESISEFEGSTKYVLSKYYVNGYDTEEYEEPAYLKMGFASPRHYYANIKVVKRSLNWEPLSTVANVSSITVDFYNRNIVLKVPHLATERVLATIPFADYFNGNYYLTFELNGLSAFHSQSEGLNISFADLVVEPLNNTRLDGFDNMDIFVKTEESYNYRQLFKDLRVPLSFNKRDMSENDVHIVNLIPDEAYSKKTPAEARDYLTYLVDNGKQDEANAIVQSCVHYLHIITNEQITYPMVIKGKNSNNEDIHFLGYYNKDYEVDDVFPSASQHIVIPFIAETKGLEAFAKFLNGDTITGDTPIKHGIDIESFYKTKNTGTLTYYDSNDFSSFISRLNDVYGYYIQSMFVTPYCEVPCWYLKHTTGNQITGCVVFNAKLVNDNAQPKTPLSKRKRKGTWWSGYTYSTYTVVSKLIEDYDKDVISSPTVVMLPFEKVQTQVVSNHLEFTERPVISFELSGTIDSPASVTPTQDFYDKVMCFGLLVGKKGFEEIDELTGDIRKQKVSLKYDLSVSNLKNNYYENVLEMEPYSFYSISMGEVESPLDRKRYYQMGSYTVNNDDSITYTYNVPLFYNQAVNTQVKIGVIPEYTINGITQRYYGDELMFVTTSGVTVKVDSYNSFMYVMSPQLKAQSHLAVYNAQRDMEKALISGLANAIAGAMSQSGAGAVQGVAGILNQQITNEQNIHNVGTNIKAQKASAGNKADTFLQSGSDYIYELNLDEYCVMLNHYRIDTLSYNSIAKMLERYGYYVNRYDELNCFSRKGYNYIKLIAFDFNESDFKLTDSQMNTINTILKQGVTLLHEKDYLHTNLHNYEVVLELVESSN